MTTRISTNNLDSSVTANFSPKISGIAIADNSYTVLDDTAVSISGGFIIISGSNFVTGCSVLIGSVVATSVSFVNSTTVRAQVPAQAAGSYTVYVTNPDGGLAIRINGLNYSATPTWSTTSPLPTGQVNSPINVQLAATSNGNVSYSLQAGSSLPAGVTLSNVGLLSGTVTGISVDTTYNFTVVATDTELQDTPQAFSITVTTNDQNFRNTTLLLSANTPGATFVTDASTNNFPVTIAGDTRPNSFGPYTPGYYSNFFDGSGDYLTIPASANLSFGTGDFTIEFWMNSTVFSRDPYDRRILRCLADPMAGAGNGYEIMLNGNPSGGTGQIMFNTPSGTSMTSTLTVCDGAWHHIAVTRNGNTFRLFVDGVQVASTTGTPTISNPADWPTWIGWFGGTGTAHYNGYLSNLRIVRGTAVYTANFTPSTTPLSAIANTSLLTCSSNRLIDASTNNFAITRTGDVRVDGFDPFVPASNTATFGSGYFDGTGDFLNPGTQSAFAFGTGDFTVECWIYATAASDSAIYEGRADSSTSDGFTLTAFSSSVIRIFSGSALISSSGTNYLNQWTHVAVCRVSGTTTLYINGVSVGTTTSLGNNATGSAVIGAGRYAGATTISNSFTGYISNFRLVKGTAVYTANFTPSTTPLAAIANTSLLTLQTNQSHTNNQFIDRSTNNFLITRNGNATAGSSSPYAGTWSNYFNGSSYLDAAGPGYNFSANWTVELWVYATAGGVIFDGRPNAINGYYPTLGMSSTQIIITVSANDIFVTPPTSVLNAWNHVAYIKNNGVFTVYFNGASIYSVSDANTWGIASSRPRLGANGGFFGAAPGFYTGYISNLRIVNGTAVYTSTFTPPIQPLAPIAGTSLLTCADNRIVDDSPNNFAITVTGGVSVQKLSPFGMQTQLTPTSYSVFFDGTGDYLTIASNAAFGYGTADFTIEFWAYFNTVSSDQTVVSNLTSASSINPHLYILGTSNTIRYYTNNADRITGPALSAGQWYHISLARQSNSTRLFVNGSQAGSTYTDSNDYGATAPIGIGTYFSGGSPVASLTINGYISNLRVVKGTAIYTANFTPPTQTLTAIAGTSLLTCQSTTLVDNSTNAFAITASGNSRPLQVNPFGYTNPAAGAYTTTALGGSMLFDGTGDYLSNASAAVANFGTNDFTFECWVYFTTMASSGFYQIFSSAGSTGGFQIYKNNNTTNIVWDINSVSTDLILSNAVANQWYHIAVARSGTTLRTFVNGVQTYSYTNSYNFTITGAHVGAYATGVSNFPGYISDLRVVKGTAVYTSAFVPPAAPLDAVRNTTLLLRGTAAGIHDSTMNNNLETVGDTRINTSVVKFAGKPSIFFDGTGDRLDSQSNPIFNFGTANFTVEFWVYPTEWTTGNWDTIFAVGQGTNNGGLLIGKTDTELFTIRQYGIANRVTTSTLPTLNAWTHVACVRSSGTSTIYYNGTAIASAADSTNYTTSQPFAHIGNSDGTTYSHYFAGYLSDLRITNGLARYTANFTAPTVPFIQY